MYVAFLGVKISDLISVFEGQIGKIVDEVNMNFTNEVNWKYI